MPPRVYPTVAEAIEAHRLLIEEFGGLAGVRDMALLEPAISRSAKRLLRQSDRRSLRFDGVSRQTTIPFTMGTNASAS